MRRTNFVLPVACLMLFAVAPMEALAASSVTPRQGVQSRTITQRTGDVRSFWTAERRASAIDPEFPSGQTSMRTASSTPSTGYVSPDPSVYPNSTAGRVYFTNPSNGMNYVCSGTVVNSANRSVVFTAGHCVHTGGSGGAWVTNWAFVPGYGHGEEPYGMWTAERLATTPGWANEHNYRYDIGAVVMRPQATGQPIAAVTGARGIAFAQSTNLVVDAFGYPVGGSWDSHSQIICNSGIAGTDPFAPGSGPAPLAILCNMGGGASGGGWVAGGNVVSVNSYLLGDRPGLLFGPYFGDAAAALYGEVSGGSATQPAAPTEAAPRPEAPPTGTQHITHPVSVSLSLTKRLVVKGAVNSAHQWCEEYVDVRIYRTNLKGVTKLVRTTMSEAEGHFRTKVKHRRGTYQARVLASDVDSFNSCAATESAPVKRRK